MAFTDIRETTSNSFKITRDDKQRLMVDVTRTFDLLSDSPATDDVYRASLALQNQGVTDTGEKIFSGVSHPLNDFFLVEDISIERKTPIIYEAKVSYKSPKYRDSNGSGDPVDPTLQPPDVKYSTVTTEEAIDEDIDGNAIATETGELYQGVTKSVSDLVVTIGKNYSIFNPVSFYDYFDSVNSDTFLGFPPGVAKVMNIAADPVIESDSLYWKVTVQIQFRKPGPNTTTARAWWTRLKHEGYYRFTEEVTEKPGVPCVDINGDNSTQPMPLDNNGFQIKKGNIGPERWREFEIYESVAFSGMNLGV